MNLAYEYSLYGQRYHMYKRDNLHLVSEYIEALTHLPLQYVAGNSLSIPKQYVDEIIYPFPNFGNG